MSGKPCSDAVCPLRLSAHTTSSASLVATTSAAGIRAKGKGKPHALIKSGGLVWDFMRATAGECALKTVRCFAGKLLVNDGLQDQTMEPKQSGTA